MTVRRTLFRVAGLMAAAIVVPNALRAQEDGSIQWNFTVALQGGISFSSPAISPDGMTIYVGATDGSVGRLLAIPRGVGPKKWQFERTGSIESSPTVSADGSTIYVSCGNGKLYALNQNDGSVKWERTLASSLTSSPALSANGTLYVGASDNRLHAYTADGTFKWTFATDGPDGLIESSPAIAADGTIYFGAYDGKVYAVNPDGTRKWDFTTGDVVFASPAIGADGTIYIGSYDQRLYAIAPDGKPKWDFPTNGAIQASPVIGADGTIYFAADTTFYALRPGTTSERVRWAKPITPKASSASTAAVRADGAIIFGDDNGFVHALSATDGREIWARDTNTKELIESSPIIASDGSIYIGSFPYLFKLNGNGSPLSVQSPWPAFRRDTRHTAQTVLPNGGGQLANISTRAQTGRPGRELIAGFVVQSVPPRGRAYLVRAVGPRLAAAPFNVTNAMLDPRLRVFSGQEVLRVNDNWGNSGGVEDTALAVGAFSFATGSKDAAMVEFLFSGAYHAHVESVDGGAGVALVEVYDVRDTGDPSARLLNLSTRGFVGAGEDMLIAGFVVRDGPMRLLLRGIGPGLSQFGVSGVLPQPRITVLSGTEALASNTRWTTTHQNDLQIAGASVAAFPLKETDADSAFLFDAKPGPYTLQIAGANGTTGIALVEVYVLP